MAWSLQWYRNSVLAWLWNEEAQQAVQRETPWFDMFSNVNTNNVAWMDILDPVSRQRQEYDQNQMRIEALNKEVETWLWTRIDDVMSDNDKQYYLNHLSKNQYEQMLKYKNEWYWFMASKALLENQYKLADTNATWLLKYKDYAEKDAHYNNSLLTPWEAQETPTSQLADWWNERYSKNIQYWTNEKWEKYVIRDDNNFWNRLANVSFGSLVNLLDTGVTWMMNIMDKWQSAIWGALDRAILWYDTDYDFYRNSDTTLINDVAQTVWSAASLALLWIWAAASPWGMAWITAFSATKPWGFVMDLTFWNLDRLVNWTLDKIDYKDYLNSQSVDSLANAITLWIGIWLAKVGWPKLKNTKIWGYASTIKWMVKNWIEKWIEYGKVQEWFERFKWTKNTPYVDIETWETWTIPEFEWYEPWYRGRIIGEVWEWFKEWVREKMFPQQETTLSEWGNTVYQGWIPWTEQTSWVSEGIKTETNGTQKNWVVNRIWTAQLRQWNKMNKSQAIKFSNKYGTDYGNWLAQRWFNQSYENNINALLWYADYTQWQKSQVLWTITQRYTDPAIEDMLMDAIQKAEYIKSPDLWKLESLALKYQNGGVTLQDADWLRQWFWYNFPLRFDGTDVSGTVARNNNMYTAMREFLEAKAAENWFPQLRELNREIAATHHIIEATTRWYNGIATNDTVSLKDLVTLAWAMANPNAWPLFMLQQALKSTKIQDRILSKLIKWKTNSERNQIKIDLDKIKKIQDAAEQRRLLEEWIAKWNLKVEEATIGLNKMLPENIVTDPNSGNWWGIEATSTFTMPEPVKAPGEIGVVETYSPKVLLKAMIEQLEVMKLIDKTDSSAMADYILKNLSPEAQQRLGEIAQKLSKGRMLTEEDSQVVKKLAEIISKENWKGLDNWEPTGYNPTDLPTNQTNNGGITEWGNPWWGISWGITPKPGEQINDWTNWWGNSWGSWEPMNQSWTPQVTDWASQNVVEVKNVDEAKQIVDWLSNAKNKLITQSDRSNYRTFTNNDRSAILSIDSDWRIVEFIQSENAPKWASDELILHAIEQWANKVDIDYDSIWLISKFDKFWFYALSKAWYWESMKVYLAHNWDVVSDIRWKIWNYELDDRIGVKKRFDTYEQASQYRDEFIRDNVWYELKDEDWWDWLKNYKNFDSNFKTNWEIKKYIDNTFKKLDSHVPVDVEEVFNKALAMARQTYNGNKNTQDLSIVYALLSEFPKNVLWRYWRPTNILKSAEKWFTFFHEFIHYSDYFGGKELTWNEVELSTIANQIKNKKRPKNATDIRAELIWDFAEIFKEIDKRSRHSKDVSSNKWYTEDVWELFARRWEAFYSDIQGKWLISSYGEMYPRKLATMFAKWLWKMNIARANWDLYDWTLQEISNMRRKHVSFSIPWVWNIRWMKVWILRDGTVWLKNAEEFPDMEERWRHWSPAKFDKFDSSHMGEWEWNQAHGWWHYIAVNKWTAEKYAWMLWGKYWWVTFKIDNRLAKDVVDNLTPLEREAFNTFKALRLNDYNNTDARKETKRRMTEEIETWIRDSKAMIEYWEKYLNNWELEEKRAAAVKEMIESQKRQLKEYEEQQKEIKGINSLIKRVDTKNHLYEVEIPDPIKKDTPTWSNYLEEDYTLNQKETNKLADAIDKYVEENNGNFKYTHANSQWRFDNGKIDRATLNDNTAFHLKREASILRNAWMIKWKNLVMDLQNLLGDKWASKFLESLGYDWIHYFWRQDGEAYVIFNDDAIDIVNYKTV